MHLNLDFPTLSLLATSLFSHHLISLAWKPPNPPPKTPYGTPDVTSLRRLYTTVRIFRFLNTVVIVYYYALLLLYPWSPQPEPPYPVHRICPNLPLLSPSLFSWSAFSFFCQSTIVSFALLRLLAFAQLGTDFSFQLAKPESLKTDGLYAWVQHPSYVGAFGMTQAAAMFLYRVDGVLGCWLPEMVVRHAEWVNAVMLMFNLWLGVMGTVRRVREEERMLKECFGREWEEWHGRTARFVPCLI